MLPKSVNQTFLDSWMSHNSDCYREASGKKDVGGGERAGIDTLLHGSRRSVFICAFCIPVGTISKRTR